MLRSVWIDGIATLTIATSRIVMKNAAPTTARISQRRGFGSAATSVHAPPWTVSGLNAANGHPIPLAVGGQLPKRAGQPEAPQDRLVLVARLRAPVRGE